jgi:multiple antibiotic resistance protein
VTETLVLAFTAFLVTIDPIGLLPIFIGLTRGAEAARRRAMALKGTAVGSAVLLLFAIVGERGLAVLGIGMPAFRIAGGLLLLVVAFEMVFERRGQRRGHGANGPGEEHHVEDIAVFPLAIPLIAGPAAITTTILLTGSHAGDPASQAVVIGAMIAVLVVVALTLLVSAALAALLGPTLVNVVSRLLGLVLAALAVQQVIDGSKAAFGP